MDSRELKDAMRSSLLDLNDQIEKVKEVAFEMECRPQDVRNTDGTFTILPLLVAKAQLLSALAGMGPQIVNSPEPRQSRPGRNW